MSSLGGGEGILFHPCIPTSLSIILGTEEPFRQAELWRMLMVMMAAVHDVGYSNFLSIFYA